MQVIAISGEKRSGKTTFSLALQEALVSILSDDSKQTVSEDQVTLHAFARRLKCILQEETLYPFTDEIWLDWAKDRPFPKEIDVDAFLLPVWDEYFPDLAKPAPLKKKADTPRRLMQIVGTDYVRAQDEQYWARYMVTQDVNVQAPFIAIVSDLRFASEYSFLADAFGDDLTVVRLSRLSSAPTPKDTHASELEVSSIPIDYGFILPEGSGELLAGIAAVFAQHYVTRYGLALPPAEGASEAAGGPEPAPEAAPAA